MVKEITNEEIQKRMDELFVRISELQNQIEECSSTSPMLPLYEESLAYAVEMFNTYESQLKSRSVGRPAVGITKKVSITLPEEAWEKLEELQKESGCSSRSELFRKIILQLVE